MSREVYDRGHAAAVLPYNPATNHVLLIRQFRPPAMVNGHPPFLLEAVAGRLEGDPPETCVRREAIEEAGVEIQQLEFVSAAYGLCAFSTEVLSMYLGTYSAWDPKVGGGLAHEGEDIQTIEIPFADAFGMINSGAIVDMKTIILLQALKIKDSLR